MGRAQRADHQTHRTPNDVSSLCVELFRAVREQEFRIGRAEGPAPSVDRAWRAWRSDLDRRGPLHLVADGLGIREGGAGPPVGRGRLQELSRRLHERLLPSVCFEPGLDAPTYAAFVSLLVTEPAELAKHGGARAFLPERGVGIRLVDYEVEDEDADEEQKPKEDVLQAPEPVAAAPITAVTTVRAAAPEIVSRPAPEIVSRPAPEIVSRPMSEAVSRPVPELDPDATQPIMAPLAEPSGLTALLTSRNDRAFAAAVEQVVAEAVAQSDAGDLEACHRAVLQLSEDASEEGGRSATQRDIALDGLRKLCSGRRLATLLERTSGPDREETLRSCRVLLQLSEQAAPALLSAIDVQRDPARRQELIRIATALGRAGTPALRRAMEGSSPRRAQIAARIAGEIHDERAVPTLSKLLDHEDADVRGEAARALARIGNVSALTTLKRGLESPHEDVSSLCAFSLGASGSEDAAQALTETLRRARRQRRLSLASAVIRSLGQLGREEGVPELRRILEKRGLFRRQELHELKLHAVAALAKVAGETARELLEEVATGSDMSLAVAARRAIKEQAEGAA